jgi:hypothetical protein
VAPEDPAAALWRALVARCASTPETDRHKVKRLVMVTEQDVRAALADVSVTDA